MRAGQEDLRPARLAAHVIDIGADAVAVAEGFARDHLVAAHHAFGAAEIDDHRTELDALDRAVHDLADAVLVFVVLALALGVAHLLHDHLLGRLGRDARKLDGRQHFGDDVADLGGGIAAPCVGERNLDLVVLDLLDDVEIARDMRLAGLGIDLDPDLVLGAVARLRGALHRLFHRVDHHRLVDRLLARDGIGDLQELEPVGGNSRSHDSLHLNAKLFASRFSRAFKLSWISRSVSTSFASAMSAKGNRTWRVSFTSVTSITTSAPSRPISKPLKRLRPSTPRISSTRAS